MGRSIRLGGRQLGLLCLIVVIAFGSVGCKKLRSNLKISKFKKLEDQTAPYNPYEHIPDEAKQASDRRDDAQRAVDSEQYDQALETSTDAVELQKAVLERARQLEAESKYADATNEKTVAENNEARKNDPQRYNEVVELYQAATDDRNESKWDNLIDKSNQIIQKVDEILQPLRNAANSEIKSAKSNRETMVKIGAEIHAREFVDDVDRLIRDAERENSDDVRSYLDAKERASEAIARAQEGINETQRVISALAIQEIEKLFDEGRTLESQKWTEDLWKQNSEKYVEINDVHYNKKDYQQAKNLSDNLIPRIKQMIVLTRKNRAEDAKNRFNDDLAKLISEEAKQYLPAQVDEIEVLNQEANTTFDSEDNPQYHDNDYDEVERMSTVGLQKIAATRDAFDNFAANEIRTATSSYNIAQKLFDDTEDVFLIKPAEFIKKIDLEFENSKKVLRKTLGTTLEDIKVNLNKSEELRSSNKKFHDSIQLARQQAKRSNDVRAETYNVVAHNAINEVADQLSRWERDGGTEFASAEVEETKKALDEAIELRELKKYKLAIEQSAEARWKLDFAIQKIAQKAVDELEQAKAEIENAIAQQALTFQPESLNEAEGLYKQAQAFLADESLKKTILTAQETQTVASRAANKSVILWTQDEINKAVTEVQRSEKAGAAFYAGERLDQAQDLLSTSRELSDAKKYPSARLSASQSIEAAQNARFAKVDATDEILDTVRKYDGWKYDYVRLSSAIEKNKAARNLMEEEQYDLANEQADEARVIAQSVLELSKVRAFEDQIAQIQKIMSNVRRSGAQYYQTRRIEDLDARIANVEGSFNIAFFDEIMLQTHGIIKDLNELLLGNKDVVQDLLEHHENRIAAIEDKDDSIFLKDRIEKAKTYLNIADVEYKKRNYQDSYTNMQRGNGLISKLENSYQRDDYLDSVREIMREYADANQRFSHLLDMDPQTLLSFARGADGQPQFVALSGTMTPYQYRVVIDELYARVIKLEAPKGYSLVERELKHIMLETRRAAANFEKLLVLDEFSDRQVEHIVGEAYDTIAKVRSRETRLNDLILHEGTTTLKI